MGGNRGKRQRSFKNLKPLVEARRGMPSTQVAGVTFDSCGKAPGGKCIMDDRDWNHGSLVPPGLRAHWQWQAQRAWQREGTAGALLFSRGGEEVLRALCMGKAKARLCTKPMQSSSAGALACSPAAPQVSCQLPTCVPRLSFPFN